MTPGTDAPALRLVVSPYALCARDAGALACMLFAGRAMTFLPRALEPVSVSRDRALGSPGFRRVMSAVAWATPLIESGVLTTTLEGADATSDFAHARRRVIEDPSLAPLRRFVEPHAESDPDRALERLARDLTRAGPDPSISIPLSAALDTLAERCGFAVLRTDGPSLSQQTERAREQRLFACSLPALVQCSTLRLLETRRRLERELVPLRDAMEACLDGLAEEPAVREAAARYADAYERSRRHIERPEDDPDDPAVRSDELVLTGVAHPPDHALVSSALAAKRVSRSAPRPTAPRPRTPCSARSIIVRRMG